MAAPPADQTPNEIYSKIAASDHQLQSISGRFSDQSAHICIVENKESSKLRNKLY